MSVLRADRSAKLQWPSQIMMWIVGAAIVAMVSGCGGGGPQDFQLESNACVLSAQGTITQSGRSSAINWSGCRVNFSASTSVVTAQLLTPGSSGSFIAPGPGWLVVNLSAYSAQNSTLPVSESANGADLPTEVPSDVASVIYHTTSGVKVFGGGTLAVGENVVYTNLHAFSLSAQLNGLRFSTGSDNITMSGTFSLQAGAATGGDSNGGGSGTCDMNACQNYTDQCSGTAQAPCYCAAACLCHCSGESSCEQQNRSSAASLGTTCTY